MSFYLWFVGGLADSSASFSNVDIVKYLPMILEVWVLFLSFFKGKSLLVNV